MSAFDVWVIRFEPGDAPPAERLQRAFGIDAASARSLAQSLPKIVKHSVHAKSAGEMRLALEAIGAVVECRPARDVREPGVPDAPAVFRAPDPDLLPVGRMSAIDPFAPATDPSVPRISVDEAVAQAAKPKPAPMVEQQPPSRITASLLATSRAQQRNKFVRQAIGTLLAGMAILAIGWFMGNSVLRGEADWIGIAFDGLGIYFVGLGAFDLVASVRS